MQHDMSSPSDTGLSQCHDPGGWWCHNNVIIMSDRCHADNEVTGRGDWTIEHTQPVSGAQPTSNPYETWSTGCPISPSTLCFCHFLGFWSIYRGTSDLCSTALEICYMIGTRIFKFDLEIAEIIEVKVGTYNTKIIFLTLCNNKMSISKWRVPTLTSIISAISKSIFKILVPIM